MEWTKEEIESHEKWMASRIDGHYCSDWDEMAVSAWTYEYDCCTDYKKSLLGRLINWFVMRRFNFGYWWNIGRHLKSAFERHD